MWYKVHLAAHRLCEISTSACHPRSPDFMDSCLQVVDQGHAEWCPPLISHLFQEYQFSHWCRSGRVSLHSFWVWFITQPLARDSGVGHQTASEGRAHTSRLAGSPHEDSDATTMKTPRAKAAKTVPGPPGVPFGNAPNSFGCGLLPEQVFEMSATNRWVIISCWLVRWENVYFELE